MTRRIEGEPRIHSRRDFLRFVVGGTALVVGGTGVVDGFNQIARFNRGTRELLGPQAATLTDTENFLEGFEQGIKADDQVTSQESGRLEELRQEIEVLKTRDAGPRQFTGIGGLALFAAGLFALYKSEPKRDRNRSNSPQN